MGKIDIYQALWGMTDLPSKSHAWSIDECLKRIENAGFDGVLQFIEDDFESTKNITQKIASTQLKLGISCFCYGLSDIEDKIRYAKQHNAQFINIMVKDYFVVHENAIGLLTSIIELGEAVGIPTYIETHRGTITQDLMRTIDYVEAIPKMLLTIDLSHYVVSGEIEEPSEAVELCFDKLLKQAASIHIRVSNGEQVQVSLNSLSDQQYNNYMRWWHKAIGYGSLKDNQPFPVIVELGPKPYQQKILNDKGEWILDGNRWEEALLWKERIHQFLGSKA